MPNLHDRYCFDNSRQASYYLGDKLLKWCIDICQLMFKKRLD